jgi:hypothetical protein
LGIGFTERFHQEHQDARTAIPVVWHAPTTTPQDRKAIIRCLVDRVVVRTDPNSEYAKVSISWAGGYVSQTRFIRPVRSYALLRDYARLKERIIDLRKAGESAVTMTAILNEEGYASIQSGARLTVEMVRGLLRGLGIRGEIDDASLVGCHEWWLRDLADELKMAWETLRGWAVRGWVNTRQTKVQHLWILWADKEEQNTLWSENQACSATSARDRSVPACRRRRA